MAKKTINGTGLKQVDRGVLYCGIWYGWDEYLELKDFERQGLEDSLQDEITERNNEIWNAHEREVMGGLK